MTETLLAVEDLEKYYYESDTLIDQVLRRDPDSIKAVDGVSFTVEQGETLGLVGESGCGKSTTGETLLRLREPTGGSASFGDENIFEMNDDRLREFRRNAQIVFQDPFSSLDPRMTAGAIVAEPLRVHDLPESDPAVTGVAEVTTDGIPAESVSVSVDDDVDLTVTPENGTATVHLDVVADPDADNGVRVDAREDVDVEVSVSGGEGGPSEASDWHDRTVSVSAGIDRSKKQLRRERAAELLERVGLSAGQRDRYPHEFSGGQRQRIGIARALALEPDFVVCDEPVSALDVSVQAQILNLLDDLQEEFGLTYLFIAHDLSVVRHISDRVAVMYLGEIVEVGPVDEIFENPSHPYTEALLESVPRAETSEHGRHVDALPGDVPSPRNPPEGCRFHTRCPYAREACKETPPTVDVDEDHQTACFRALPDHEYWESEMLDHADRE